MRSAAALERVGTWRTGSCACRVERLAVRRGLTPSITRNPVPFLRVLSAAALVAANTAAQAITMVGLTSNNTISDFLIRLRERFAFQEFSLALFSC